MPSIARKLNKNKLSLHGYEQKDCCQKQMQNIKQI
jgi:hypothetical protein